MKSTSRRASAVFLVLLVFAVSRMAFAQATPTTITIHAKTFAFNPAEITLKQGQPVNLLFVSDDVPHGIAIEGLGIHLDFRKHHSAQILVTPPAVGDFQGECSVFCGAGHDMMQLIVHVVP